MKKGQSDANLTVRKPERDRIANVANFPIVPFAEVAVSRNRSTRGR